MSTPLRRIGLGMGANVLARFNTIALQLVSVPLFLAFWGTELYGEWLLLTTIPAYLAMSDIGFTTVAANQMTIHASAGEHDRARRIFQATWALVCTLFVVIAGLAVLGLWFLPFERWLNISHLNHQAAFIVLLWMLVRLAMAQQVGLVLGVFRAEKRYPLGILLANVMFFSQFLATAIVLLLDGGPTEVAAAEAAVGALFCAGLWIYAGRLAPWARLTGLSGSLGTIPELIRPAIGFFGYTMSFALVLQGASTLVGVMLGPTAVVVFNTIRTLTRVPLQLVDTVSNSIWPEFSVAHGEGKPDLLRRLHRRAVAVNIWGSTLVVLCLLPLGHWVHQTWTHGEVAWSTPLFLGMLAVVWATGWNYASAVAALSINRHDRLSAGCLLSALVSMLAAIPLLQMFGLPGMALALLLDQVLRTVIAGRVALALIDDRLGALTGYVLRHCWPEGLTLARRILRRSDNSD